MVQESATSNGGELIDQQAIHFFTQLTANGKLTDAEVAATLKALNQLRGSSGKIYAGLLNRAGTKYSTTWLKNADTGNRGFAFEVKAAANLQAAGEIPRDGRVFGKTIPNATDTAALVEGDIAYTLPSGGDRYIDIKLSNGKFELDQVRRGREAIDGLDSLLTKNYPIVAHALGRMAIQELVSGAY
jgi:hypothetical protein